MFVKLAKWLIFGVLVGLSPFFVLIGCGWMRDGTLNVVGAFAQGELLIFAAAVAAEGLGETVASKSGQEGLTVLTGGFCALLVLVAALGYGMMQASVEPYDAWNVFVGTGMVLMMSIVVNGATKVLTAPKEPKP